MRLSVVPQTAFDVQPICWGALPRRFMNPGELEVLIALARLIGARAVLEFGCNEGRTARAILDNVPSVEFYQGLDVPRTYRFTKAVQRGEAPVVPGRWARMDPRFDLVMRPRGSFDLTADDLEYCDLAFIDGDHSRAGVENDTALARQLVRPGGLIVWHDYHQQGTVDVAEVLEEMAAAGAPIRHIEGTWLAFERVGDARRVA